MTKVKAHIVLMDSLSWSGAFGVPVVSICGKVWVPKEEVKGKQLCKNCDRRVKKLYPGKTDGPTINPENHSITYEFRQLKVAPVKD